MKPPRQYVRHRRGLFAGEIARAALGKSVGVEAGEDSTTTMISLQKLFDRYNRRFFSGRLPKYEIITDGTYAGGRCDSRKNKIYLEYPTRNYRTVLLHEMAHILHPRHGPKWRREMARLRQAGAPITREEYEGYAKRNHTMNHVDIKNEIVDAALETQIPVDDLVQSICYSYGIVAKTGGAETKFAKNFVRTAIAAANKAREEFATISAAKQMADSIQ